MQSGCDTKPNVTLGETVPLQRALFDTATVIPTATSQTITAIGQTASSTLASGTSHASVFSSASFINPGTTTPASPSSTRKSDKSALSSGAAGGIGVGCGVSASAIIGWLVWCILRKRRQRRRPRSGVDQKDVEPMSLRYQSVLPSSGPANAYQLESSELHEIDSLPSNKVRANELDGRPMR